MNDKPTKIFAHGFGENGYSIQALQIRDAYLHKEDCNYISVDWENLAILPFYPRSAISSVIVGVFTGVFINFLVEQGADLNQFHVIGFSMGAHIAGNAGSTVKGTLPRITGLDPAYPFFSLFGTDQRLDITDAEFVDIIHCNSGTVGRILDIEQLITDFQVTVSYPEAIGHADFYPNGGSSQPGCGIIHSGGFIDFMQSCSHNRAFGYFVESIGSLVGFNALLCDSWEEFKNGSCDSNESVLMGYPTPETTRGVFYLATKGERPYAIPS